MAVSGSCSHVPHVSVLLANYSVCFTQKLGIPKQATLMREIKLGQSKPSAQVHLQQGNPPLPEFLAAHSADFFGGHRPKAPRARADKGTMAPCGTSAALGLVCLWVTKGCA